MKKVLSLFTSLFITAILSVSAFAADIPAEKQQTAKNSIVANTNTDLSAFESEATDDIIIKSDVKSFKGKFSGLFTDLDILREECKNLWTSIKTSNQNIKSQWKTLKESLKGENSEEAKEVLSNLKSKTSPLHTQIEALHSDIKILRDQKNAEWGNFKGAVKAKDESKASTALSNIISYKKQIIEKQKLILELKQQILDLLKS
ncbi:MAG: hypothetical protein N3I35_13150 [Clostridia bacterium]|nr:hypothetical protein [Clostridia bacterium]